MTHMSGVSDVPFSCKSCAVYLYDPNCARLPIFSSNFWCRYCLLMKIGLFFLAGSAPVPTRRVASSPLLQVGHTRVNKGVITRDALLEASLLDHHIFVRLYHRSEILPEHLAEVVFLPNVGSD